jgi:multimeric flavodoxin WrbA
MPSTTWDRWSGLLSFRRLTKLDGQNTTVCTMSTRHLGSKMLHGTDVVAFGTPAAAGSVGAELRATLSQIAIFGNKSLAGKAATAFTSSYGALAGAELALSELQSRLLRLGFVTLPVPEEAGIVRSVASLQDYELARIHGRKLAALGRALHAR